jgi:hypothetical protein
MGVNANAPLATSADRVRTLLENLAGKDSCDLEEQLAVTEQCMPLVAGMLKDVLAPGAESAVSHQCPCAVGWA